MWSSTDASRAARRSPIGGGRSCPAAARRRHVSPPVSTANGSSPCSNPPSRATAANLPEGSTGMSLPTPILYDCDPGHDDAIALVMAHRSAGHPACRRHHHLRQCRDREDHSQCHPGARCDRGVAMCRWRRAAHRPLARPLVLGTADGPSGLEGSPYLPPPSRAPMARHAVDFLADTLRAAPAAA